MAVIIDERVAGGRPQKLSSPSLMPMVRAAAQIAVRVRSMPNTSTPNRRVLTGARA